MVVAIAPPNAPNVIKRPTPIKALKKIVPGLICILVCPSCVAISHSFATQEESSGGKDCVVPAAAEDNHRNLDVARRDFLMADSCADEADGRNGYGSHGKTTWLRFKERTDESAKQRAKAARLLEHSNLEAWK
jgi:hypothetical protein